jgi:hypothetical protein
LHKLHKRVTGLRAALLLKEYLTKSLQLSKQRAAMRAHPKVVAEAAVEVASSRE